MPDDTDGYGRDSVSTLVNQKAANSKDATASENCPQALEAGNALEHRQSFKARQVADAEAGRALEHQLSLRERAPECDNADDPWLVHVRRPQLFKSSKAK